MNSISNIYADLDLIATEFGRTFSALLLILKNMYLHISSFYLITLSIVSEYVYVSNDSGKKNNFSVYINGSICKY